MDEHVALVQGGEDVGVLRQGRLRRDEGGVLELAQVQVGDDAQAGQVERPGQVVDGTLVDREFGHEPFQHAA